MRVAEAGAALARRRRVLILYGNPLFAGSLRSLLAGETELEVAMTEAAGSEDARVLSAFRPHVLIVEENAALSPENRAYIHSHAPTVIRLSLQDTTMRVSQKRQIPSASAQDLLVAIRSRGLTLRGHKQRQHETSKSNPQREAEDD